MIKDKSLIEKAQRVISLKPRRQVTAADILAVIQKESSGVATFSETEPLYLANLKAALEGSRVSKEDLLKLLTIDYGPLRGEVAKFRFEPGYWYWSSNLRGSWTAPERALLACSLGVGQKMVRWLVSGVPGAQWVSFARRFAGNVDLQLTYVAGDLDQLLVEAGGSRPVAYTRYNEGVRRDARGIALPRISDYGRTVNDFYRAYVGALK